MTDVILGMEVVGLLEHGLGPPYKMVVDAYDSETRAITRHTIIGRGYERKERSIADMEPFYGKEAAEKLDHLDRIAAERITPIAAELFRAQIKAIHGQEGLDWLDAQG